MIRRREFITFARGRDRLPIAARAKQAPMVIRFLNSSWP